MNNYIAWLDGFSVQRGTLAQCKAKAKEVFDSSSYREYGKNPATVKITRGARQLFVASYILERKA